MAPATAAGPGDAASEGLGPGGTLGLFAAFALLALLVYQPALQGPFVSDDIGYIGSNPFTASLTRENLLAIFDPGGDASRYTANYAPIHLLATALERHMFAESTLGYHLVNVVVHAGNAVLLVLLLAGSGVAQLPALLGGAFFLLHPANVEAVAWISQLKSSGALLFALGALLAFRRRPALATALFVLGLLTKASAAFALPAAAAFVFVRAEPLRKWAWLAVWLGILVLFSIPQFASFAHLGEVDVGAFDDRSVHARTVAAIGARYLVMAATSYGVAAFQEPLPVTTWTDPWLLLALPAGALLAWRAVAALRRRREEAVWWIAAAAAFGPVSQLFPFLIPVADRYLYFILPGLVGGSLLAGRDAVAALATTPGARRVLGQGLAAACAALLLLFGGHAAARARLWQNETRLLLDAARAYPAGATAHYLAARRAAQQGDVPGALAALRAAADRGLDRFAVLDADPGLAPIRGDERFRAFVDELAGRWIERARARGVSNQADLRMLARAHVEREEFAEAVEVFTRALQAGGPFTEAIRLERDEARRALDRRRGGGRG